jgi:predicted RNA-binding Zn-ribbon protein involved in translation (DUF1610 family)
MKWLRSIVGDEVPLHSIIAFSERCSLKKVNITSNEVQVINRNVIARSVEQLGSMQSRKLSLEEIIELHNKLYPYTQISEEQKHQHIQNIKMNHYNPQLNIDNVCVRNTTVENEPVSQICPKCGMRLVLRTAKKGINTGQQFYGCSNYPKCRFIR